MRIGEVAGRIGRSVETIKRWEELGLLFPRRDERGQRRFDPETVERCIELAALGMEAQRRSQPLHELASALPVQLSLAEMPAKR